MAVDTRTKRFSMITLAGGAPGVFPNPDGAISVYDRAQYLWLYAGLDISIAIPVVLSNITGNLTPTANITGNLTPTANVEGV